MQSPNHFSLSGESKKGTAKRLRDEAMELLERAQKKLKEAEEIESTLNHRPQVKEDAEFRPLSNEAKVEDKKQLETISRKNVGDILYSFHRRKEVNKYIVTSVGTQENGNHNGNYSLQICNIPQTTMAMVIGVNETHMGKTYFDRLDAKTLIFHETKRFRKDFLGVHIPEDLKKDHKIYYVENGAVYKCNVTLKRDLNAEMREYHISGNLHTTYNKEATPDGEVNKRINGNTPGAFGRLEQALIFAASSCNASTA